MQRLETKVSNQLLREAVMCLQEAQKKHKTDRMVKAKLPDGWGMEKSSPGALGVTYTHNGGGRIFHDLETDMSYAGHHKEGWYKNFSDLKDAMKHVAKRDLSRSTAADGVRKIIKGSPVIRYDEDTKTVRVEFDMGDAPPRRIYHDIMRLYKQYKGKMYTRKLLTGKFHPSDLMIVIGGKSRSDDVLFTDSDLKEVEALSRYSRRWHARDD